MDDSASIRRDGDWWIGWVEEVPGVNSQAQTQQAVQDNPRDALEEVSSFSLWPHP